MAKLTRAAAGLLSAAGILALVAPAEAGGPAFVEGSGTARAQTARFAPHTGGLTYALTEGVALASYEGTVGRAQAQTLDLGLYGLVLTTVAPCGGKPPLRPEQLPQPLRANSSGGGPPEASRAYAGGELAAGGTESARAEPGAASAARTTAAAITIPVGLTVDGGWSQAQTRLVPGRRREAHAESGIASVRLANGLVELRGLHWDATQRTGEEPVAAGGFHLDEVLVGGALLPLPGEGLPGALPRLEDVLAPLGLSIEAPAVVQRSNGATEVTPLRIRTGGETRLSGPTGQLLGATQPVRDALAGAVKGDPQNCNDPRAAAGPLFGAGLLLGDITLAAATGTGGLDIELGGAQAMTEGNVYDDPFGNRRPVPLPPVRTAPPPVWRSAASEPPVEAPVPEPQAAALSTTAPDPAPALDAAPVRTGPAAETVVRQRSSTRCATAHPFGRPACSQGAASLAGAGSLVLAVALFAGDALIARRRRTEAGS